MEQRDGVDERQVFLMVAAGARAAAGEGQVPGEGIGDEHGLDQALGVCKRGPKHRMNFLAGS